MTDSTYRLGGVSEERRWPAHETNTNDTAIDRSESDHSAKGANSSFLPKAVDFVRKDGQAFAGLHLLIEFWDARNLSDVEGTEEALVSAAEASGATVLHSYMHPFGPEMGVSGVVVLAESHISIHTWPERGYAAIDVFMCGDCDPHMTLPVLRGAFEPGRVSVSEQRRGIVG